MTTYTYILKSSKDGSFYVGISQDVENRIKTHNTSRVSSTSHKIPWELVYTKEHSSYKDARQHEKWLKKKNHGYKNKLSVGLPRPTKLAGKERQKVVVEKKGKTIVIKDWNK